MALIRVNNITKQFSSKFVLHDFSFEVNEGDKINIVGPSGIGKTTLFRLLLGFEKPDEGEIYFNNQSLTDANVWNVRQQIAYVCQELNIGRGRVSQFFRETFEYKANQAMKEDALNKLDSYLEHFDLSKSVLDKNIEDLSGGEKQRIAIINALLLNRKIFFLDEITSALDPALKEKVLSFFIKNDDFTVMYISHDNYVQSFPSVKTLKLING